MRRIVKIKHPLYGDLELNVDKVIAVVPKRCQLLFEYYKWDLDFDEFAKVYEIWSKE